MKTPREILMERHRHADARLDRVRRQVLGGLQGRSARRITTVARLLRELFALPNPAWGGLAAAWTVIVALNLAVEKPQPNRPATMPERTSSAERALEEQRRLYTELVRSPDEAQPPTPRPRSQRATASQFA